jgi:hypothetical protein
MLTAMIFKPLVAQGQELLQGWYQIDVILFRPKAADLDEENWSEVASTYPAEVISVTKGDVFKLSQLEHLDASLPTATVELAQELSNNDFAFEGQSNRNRNRRVIERVTGMSDDDSSEDSSGGLGNASNEAASSGVPVALSVEDIIDAAIG